MASAELSRRVLGTMPAALLIPALLLAAVSTSAAAPTVPAARGQAARAYLQRLLDSIVVQERHLPSVAAVAEAVAEKLVAGADLWLAGSHRGFIMEGLGRAGGMMAIKWLQDPADLQRGDVVLVGAVVEDNPEDIRLLQLAARRRALAVLFAPEDPLPIGEHLYVDPFAPPANNPRTLPIASPAIAASLWTFTGELVGALIRCGKMPPMYQSVLVPGGCERNDRHLKLKWELPAQQHLPPVSLGRTYLARLVACLWDLRGKELPKFEDAGRMAAQVKRSGHTAWYAALGHMPPEQPGQVGDPGVLEPLPVGPAPEGLAEHVHAGDLILYVGYYEPWGPWVETAHRLGARIVTIVSGTPEHHPYNMGAEINIAAWWPYGDALVEVPGYDVKILPPSGVLQSAAYWMLVAETAAALQERYS